MAIVEITGDMLRACSWGCRPRRARRPLSIRRV